MNVSLRSTTSESYPNLTSLTTSARSGHRESPKLAQRFAPASTARYCKRRSRDSVVNPGGSVQGEWISMSQVRQVAIQPPGRTLTRSLWPHSRQCRGASRSARQPTHSVVPQPVQKRFRAELWIGLDSAVSAGWSTACSSVLEHPGEGADRHLQVFEHQQILVRIAA